MRKKRINCMSCEVKTDVIVWEANVPEDQVEVIYCPVCSVEIMDYSEFGDNEDE